MKSLYKYCLLFITFIGIVLTVLHRNHYNGGSSSNSDSEVDSSTAKQKASAERTRKQAVAAPLHSHRLDMDSPFNVGLFQGVGSVQIELAMAERRLPPLKPTFNDPDAPLPPMKKILIVSTWRTGSSFLGDLIQSAPGAFYSYEPLHFIDEEARIEDKELSIELIRSIFQCQFTADYLEHINGQNDSRQVFMSTNRRVWEACRHDRSLCAQPDFVHRLCTHFPVQLMKVVRLPLSLTRELIDLDPKIIFLVRDPRGVMASRANLNWCQHPSCSEASQLCRQMDEDLKSYEQLRDLYPEHYYLLKFEDLSSDVDMETAKLFDFLGMKVSLPVKVFLQTHTKSKPQNSKDPYSTQRLSKSIPTAWRQKLSASEASLIAGNCSSVLKSLNYPLL